MPVINPASSTTRLSLGAMLHYAWDSEVFTSNDAMPSVGLTRSTTIDALNELIDLGLVEELSNAREGGEYRKGRPARRFALRGDAGTIVGVDAGQAHLSVAVADLRGRVMGRHDTYLDPSDDEAEARRQAIVQAVDQGLSVAGKTRSDVVSLCVGVPAPVAADGTSPPHPDAFWQRMNPQIAEVFQRWAPLVRVENDSSLAAAAERRFGAAVDSADFVALMAGRRFGAGVVSGGRLLRGHSGGVGEMFPLAWLMGAEGLSGLGELLATGAKDALASGLIPRRHPLAKESKLTAEAVLAHSSDPAVAPVIDQVAHVLARVVGLLGSMYDPDRVILCGAIAAGSDAVIDRTRELLPAELHLPAPKLVASGLGADVVTTGAVAAAVEEAQTSILDLVSSGRFTVSAPR